MDADIAQLLKSLNLDGISVEEPVFKEPSASPPPVYPHQPVVFPKKKKRQLMPLVTGLSILVVVGIGCALFFTQDLWWGRPARIVHIYESAARPWMVPPFASATQKIEPWSTNDLVSHLLPSGSLSETSSFAGHLDILKAAAGRRDALEEVRQDVDALMANCIHAPDMATRGALHRAISRFDVADVNLTHSLIPLIVSKRSSLATQQDRQKLNETLAFAGLGKGLEEYSTTVVQIAATQEFIEQFLSTLRDERDVCRLAETFESALQLFAGLRKDLLMPSFIDLDARQKEASDACLHSLEETLRQFPSSQYPRRCSLLEHKAVSFLQGQFPSIDPSLFAKVDGFLMMKDKPLHVRASLENNLASTSFSSSTTKMFMAPEGILTD